jgi:hypothetical protein
MRRVTDAERRFLASHFGHALDTDRIRIGTSVGRRSWSPYGGRISLTRDLFSEHHPRSVVRLDDARAASIFAHEALHVWQRQVGRRVTWEGAGLQAGYTLGLFDPYAYDQTIADPAALLTVFVLGNIEQQGRIFQDYVHAELSGGDTERFRRVVDWVRHGDR